MSISFPKLSNALSHLSYALFPSKSKKIEETKIVVKGSQEGKIGEVDLRVMFVFFNKLRANTPKGVTFSASRLTRYLYGGTCSSMVFNFIRDYFDQKVLDEDMGLAIELSKKYSKSGKKFRSEQVALNTIERDIRHFSYDFKKDKVQAIANPYDLKITGATEIQDLSKLLKYPKTFGKTLENLPNGVYVLRDLYISHYNHKGERWGHTMALFKLEEGYLLYDPNFGLMQITEDEICQRLLEHFKKLKSEWSVHEPRLYKVQSVANRILS